ncbi:uncharacterized protein LOC118753442 [Rhagoletis pomonella]|uniref:uncharacterized protein LOC118753442 n=1 Tax=Rhagoletis pomonella TaxID=28610 RepID=UPI00177F2AE4|nr:uncharacterized protein LOC118753442 [Rhagoletis pomonella]
MDDLTDYSSEIIEFLPTKQLEKQSKVVEACVNTDPEPPSQDKSVETTPHSNTSTQTELFTSQNCEVDERKLANWLRKICPAVEQQLLKGPTPLSDGYDSTNSFAEQYNIQTYQKIAMGAVENSQGIAAWLSVHTNNAPILVASTKAPHDDWCDHLQQTLKLFVPKRIPTGNLVMYNEVKSVPLKSCLNCFSTNGYNKNIFAGSTMDGDIYIWLCSSGGRGDGNNLRSNTAGAHEIEELCCTTSPHGCAVALNWPSENRLLSFHSNGTIICWAVGKELLLENEFQLRPQLNASNEITAAVCLSSNTFAVGVKDGSIFLCTITSFGGVKRQMEILPLKKHSFMVSTLLKSCITDYPTIISCDLSGQVYYHSITNMEEENQNVIHIPLPFKNAIACSKDGNVVYCPGIDGSLECYSVRDGAHTIIQGSLRGKGNFIASSDNGNWIITGLYQDDFQIFYIEN